MAIYPTIKQLNNDQKQASGRVGGTTNMFVSFTELEKLGIAPKSGHGTPIGIYAYPVDYVIKSPEAVVDIRNATKRVVEYTIAHWPQSSDTPFPTELAKKHNITINQSL